MKNKSKKTYRKISSTDIENIKCLESLEDKKTILRQLRQTECFKFVDRPIWYNKLSEMQKQEINKWYEEWLSVTDTFVIPERPYWVK